MVDAMETLREQLKAVRDNYIVELSSKIQEIEKEWARLEGEGPLPEKLEALYRRVHRLSGSGATFGFSTLTNTALELEHLLKTLYEGKALPDKGQTEQIDALVQALRKASETCDDEMALFRVEGMPFASPREGDPAQASKQKASRICVFSEDLRLVKSFEEIIPCQDFELLTVSEPAELKAALERGGLHAVILDFDLTAKRSRLVHGTLSKSLAEKNLPVVVLCSDGRAETRLEAVRAGGKAFFTKPVDIHEIYDKVQELRGMHEDGPYRILIMEDDTELRDASYNWLTNCGMLTLIVKEPLNILSQLIEFKPDLILSDVSFSDHAGPELAEMIRQNRRFASIPIVHLGTEEEFDKRLPRMRFGNCDDFLFKPVYRLQLVERVRLRAKMARKSQAMSGRDGLTGLLNHSSLRERLSLEVARAARQGSQLSLALIDLDHFKTVNTTYGYAVGDQLLRRLARRLERCVVQKDILGRVGGDKLAMIIVGSSKPSARERLDAVNRAFHEMAHRASGETFHQSLSIGIASSDDFPDARSLYEAAERALRLAKQQGRKRSVYIEEEV